MPKEENRIEADVGIYAFAWVYVRERAFRLYLLVYIAQRSVEETVNAAQVHLEHAVRACEVKFDLVLEHGFNGAQDVHQIVASMIAHLEMERGQKIRVKFWGSHVGGYDMTPMQL